VFLNDRKVGSTNRKGVYVYSGSPVKNARLKISATGYIPQTWDTSVDVQGKKAVGHHFYPATPNPIRVGIHGFVNNSPDKDLTDVIHRVESAIGDHLFAHTCFKEVSQNHLKQLMGESHLDMETIATKGWQNTALDNTVDVIVSGSVTADDAGMTIETTVITADGHIILSQINRARKAENIGSSTKVIVNGIVNQFPFEGTIAVVDAGGYRINLGTAGFNIRRGNEFRYMSVQTDGSGHISGFREAGLLRVVDTEDTASLVEAVDLKPDQTVAVGDRVVRRIYLEQQKETEKASAVILVNGGIFPDEKPLWGVNVYLGSTWMGTTGADGKVQIPLSLYTEHDLLLSRHGYKPVRDVISVDADRQVKEFYLEVANALFRAESEPTNADVFVDGVKIGAPPLLEGKLVTFGFRKIRLSVGGDYRDWEEVVEVQQPEVDRTGENRIVFVKDYLKIGKKAEAAGDVDGAMRAYASTEKGNPDYSISRCRLAQLYMDEKSDFDAAIGEFENVLALPENRQIIYKQFAVTYTNLGHAYYEKGNALVQADPQAAARNFAKAIEKLTTAKQNTRFFPNDRFDEAVHDTYYYTALAYHKLYLVTKKRSLIHKTDIAWREYFDFFPKALANKGNFAGMRDTGEKYWTQIKSMM
jgi:tetratricopeptide (TPR) repeat protein